MVGPSDPEISMAETEISELQPDIEHILETIPESDHQVALGQLATARGLRLMYVRRAYQVALFLRSQRGRRSNATKHDNPRP